MSLADEPAPKGRVLQAGARLGGYRLERVLGEGGMGVVWAAHDPDLDRAVALKVLRHGEASSALRKRLLREARAMARLKHPNVLVVYEVGSDGDRDFIAMELVDARTDSGASLDHWLEQKPRPTRRQILDALLGAGRGLAAAHAAGLVHRDFKPHNVLRQSDGRVVVSDFGLARGIDAERGDDPPGPEAVDTRDLRPTLRALGDDATQAALDETADARTPAAALEETFTPPAGTGASQPRNLPAAERRHRTDSVLDSTLTQTGALLGTPAYMAPEQFAGATPDQRTDQFAYCVTAWQALTGERPFRGATIEELRAAVSSGTTAGGDGLGRGVRGVLARGLSPDPAKRWPDMPTLLAALERAERRPRTIAIAVAATLAVATIALAFAWSRRADDPRPPAPVPAVRDGCADAEAEIARAWTPDRRTGYEARLGRGFAALADQLDRYRERWIRDYNTTCEKRDDRAFHNRVGCLLGQRDEIEAFTLLLEHASPDLFAGRRPYGLIPNLDVCASAAPYAPPALPADPQQRGAIQQLRAKIIELRVPPDRLDAQADDLIAEAERINWLPVVAEVYEATGIAAHLLHRIEPARERIEKAIERADRSKHERVAATARIARLELESTEASEPQSAKALDAAIEETRTAIARAGADRHLTAVLDLLIGDIVMARGGLWEGAIAANRARKVFLQLGDVERALVALDHIAASLDHVPSPSELQTLDDIVATTEAAAPRPPPPVLDRAIARIAWWRRRLDDAHQRYDRAFAVPDDTRPLVTGRVLDPGGAPHANAIVVAWTGDLYGDGTRLYTDPAAVYRDGGAIARTDAAGNFSIRAEPGAAVIAEAPGGAMRSVPRALGAGGDVQLVATRVVKGRGDMGGELFARYTTANASWYLMTLIDPIAGFELAGALPGGEAGGRAQLDLHGTVRRIFRSPTLEDGFAGLAKSGPSSYARTLDVILRTKKPQDFSDDVWVFDGNLAPLPAKRAELDALAEAATFLARGTLGAVGADATDEGRHVYKTGDLHVPLRELHVAKFTACIAGAPARGGPAAPVTCRTGVTTKVDDSVEDETVIVLIEPPSK